MGANTLAFMLAATCGVSVSGSATGKVTRNREPPATRALLVQAPTHLYQHARITARVTAARTAPAAEHTTAAAQLPAVRFPTNTNTKSKPVRPEADSYDLGKTNAYCKALALSISSGSDIVDYSCSLFAFIQDPLCDYVCFNPHAQHHLSGNSLRVSFAITHAETCLKEGDDDAQRTPIICTDVTSAFERIGNSSVRAPQCDPRCIRLYQDMYTSTATAPASATTHPEDNTTATSATNPRHQDSHRTAHLPVLIVVCVSIAAATLLCIAVGVAVRRAGKRRAKTSRQRERSRALLLSDMPRAPADLQIVSIGDGGVLLPQLSVHIGDAGVLLPQLSVQTVRPARTLCYRAPLHHGARLGVRCTGVQRAACVRVRVRASNLHAHTRNAHRPAMQLPTMRLTCHTLVPLA